MVLFIQDLLFGLEKDNLINSLQEDLENATNREVTRMSSHGEAAAILPMHSMTTNDDHIPDDDMQEMHQVCCHSKLCIDSIGLF